METVYPPEHGDAVHESVREIGGEIEHEDTAQSHPEPHVPRLDHGRRGHEPDREEEIRRESQRAEPEIDGQVRRPPSRALEREERLDDGEQEHAGDDNADTAQKPLEVRHAPRTIGHLKRLRRRSTNPRNAPSVALLEGSS